MKRTVLITGANRGIGLAIARQLAGPGNSVLLGSHDLKAGEDAAKSLRRPGLDVEPVHIDLTDCGHDKCSYQRHREIRQPGRCADQ